MRSRTLFLIYALVASTVTVHAQYDIPLGEWRLHVSFNRIIDVAAGDAFVYAAAPNGVIVVDKSDNSFQTLHKGNALSRTGITAIAADATRNLLLVAYDEGTFDIIADNKVSFFDPARGTVIAGSKKVNSIKVQGDFAYFSTDYGVLVFDLQRMEIRETWRDLGPSGSTLSIRGSAFLDDRVFLATAQGVMAGELSANLLDFSNWVRFSEASLPAPMVAIAASDNAVYAGGIGSGVYAYREGTWAQESFLTDRTVLALDTNEGSLLITAGDDIYRYDDDNGLSPLIAGSPIAANDAVADDTGAVWIAGKRTGLIAFTSNDVSSILPDGPSTDSINNLVFVSNRIYATSGGRDADAQPLGRPGTLDFFVNGGWDNEQTQVSDLTDVDFSTDGQRVIASFGHGVTVGSMKYDDSNSTLLNSDPGNNGVYVTSVVTTPQGLYAANYDAVNPLHFFDGSSWEAFPGSFPATRYPLKLITDYQQNVWAILDPARGGGLMVYNRGTNESRYLTTQDQQGELPGNAVYALAMDRDGYVWAGTNAGVAYFFDAGSDAIKPLFENRFLLRDDRVTAIAVDGGNRKWMGTQRGVWLFSPSGESSLGHFTTENSPLLSDEIVAIEVDHTSGEVFFATARGVVSFRSDATKSNDSFDQVKVFPNPVTSTFSGLVGISGLASDAIVKITDVSGRLIWQTQANGGTASWNVRDHAGNRVRTGMYLVFAVRGDGSESVVGKIAVVN